MDERRLTTERTGGSVKVQEAFLKGIFEKYGIWDGSHVGPWGVVDSEVRRAVEKGLSLTHEGALFVLLRKHGVPSQIKFAVGIIWGALYGVDDVNSLKGRLGKITEVSG